jgi:ApaG protein
MKKKILINVEPTYLEEHSDPFEDSYLWAYKVIIKNNSEHTIKLISRH